MEGSPGIFFLIQRLPVVSNTEENAACQRPDFFILSFIANESSPRKNGEVHSLVLEEVFLGIVSLVLPYLLLFLWARSLGSMAGAEGDKQFPVGTRLSQCSPMSRTPLQPPHGMYPGIYTLASYCTKKLFSKEEATGKNRLISHNFCWKFYGHRKLQNAFTPEKECILELMVIFQRPECLPSIQGQ